MIPAMILAGLGPPLAAMSYFWMARVWHPLRGPIRKAFGWGFLAAFPIALVGFLALLSVSSIEDEIALGAAVAFFSAAIPEETGKLLVLLFLCLREDDNKQPLNAMVLAISVSLGFAAIENLLYVITVPDWDAVAIGRALISVPMHAVAGATMGYFAARTLESEGTADISGLLMLVGPILLHGLFDFPILSLSFLQANGADLAQHELLLSIVVAVSAIPIFAWILILWWLHGAARTLEPALTDGAWEPATEGWGYAATRSAAGPAPRRGFGRRNVQTL